MCSKTTHEFETEFREMIKANPNESFILDFKKTKILGKTFFGLLRKMQKSILAKGNDVKLCNLSDTIRRGIANSEFSNSFQIYPSRAHAMETQSKLRRFFFRRSS